MRTTVTLDPDVESLLRKAMRERASARLEAAFENPGGVGFAWVVLLGFVRVGTRRGMSIETACVSSMCGCLSPARACFTQQNAMSNCWAAC